MRRAFLCGIDAYSGQSSEHWRGWIAERAQQLASVFAINEWAEKYRARLCDLFWFMRVSHRALHPTGQTGRNG